MTATFLRRDNGEYIEERHIVEFLNGSKWYWLEFENGDTKKLKTSEYQLMSIHSRG